MLNAYDKARLAGFVGSLRDFYKSVYSDQGFDGLKEAGYSGTPSDAKKSFLSVESALSAYDLACQYGFKGTPSEYVKSLKGLDGLDAFDVAVKSGFSGTQSEWLRSLQGDKGLDAFESAAAKGFDGDLAQWLESLKGLKGDTGPMPEHQWIGTSLQFERTDGAFGVAVDLVGPRGDKGDKGDDGDDGKDGEMPNHQIDGQRIRFEKPGGGFGAWVDLGRDRPVSSGGGGSLSLQKFHDGVDDFPTPGKKQILYFDTSVSPYGTFIWDGQKYEQIGGGGGGEIELPPHNELDGRSNNDAHPISSITGLREELDILGEVESPEHNELNGRSNDDAHPISSITGLQEVLDNLGGGNGNGGGSSSVRNLQAILIFNLINDVQVQNGEQFDLTPNAEVGNSFGSLLVLDAASRVIKTFSTGRLNLGIDVFLQLSSGALVAYDVALQRANEATIIERTKRQIFRRPAQGAATGGPTGVTLSSFTSGEADPFNISGFKIYFLNTSGQTITIEAGEIRIDIFSVYDLGIESPQ